MSAAALELYHNAFLVHDDVEDGSDYRRGKITMLRAHGAAIAVNVGDATNVLAMQLLLEKVSAPSASWGPWPMSLPSTKSSTGVYARRKTCSR